MKYKIITFLEPVRAEVTGQPSSLKSKERQTPPRTDEMQALAYWWWCTGERDVRCISGRKERAEEIKMENYLKVMRQQAINLRNSESR